MLRIKLFFMFRLLLNGNEQAQAKDTGSCNL